MNDLKRAKHFCILPWVHVKIENTGTVAPCCRSDSTFTYGSLRSQKFEEIWNGEPVRKMRLALLRDEVLPQCRNCRLNEDAKILSERQIYNLMFAGEFKRAAATRNDGSIDQNHLLYLDVRFSNICNFKCRICNPKFSTSWVPDYKILSNQNFEKVIRPTPSREELWKFIDSQIPSLRKIYFAGGEPLQEEDHYLLLEKLIAQKRTDVILSYNTNLSKLTFKRWKALDLWSHFKTVRISASLDGIGAQAEFMRKGTEWKNIENNFKIIRSELPSVSLGILATISVMNAFHIVSAVKRWLELGWIASPLDIGFNILHEPANLNLNILSQKEREKLRETYETFFSYLERHTEPELARAIRSQFRLILVYLGKDPLLRERKEFVQWTKRLDAIREESFVEVFPEFRGLFEEVSC